MNRFRDDEEPAFKGHINQSESTALLEEDRINLNTSFNQINNNQTLKSNEIIEITDEEEIPKSKEQIINCNLTVIGDICTLSIPSEIKAKETKEY